MPPSSSTATRNGCWRESRKSYERAKELDIEGRSVMSKDELIRAIRLSA